MAGSHFPHATQRRKIKEGSTLVAVLVVLSIVGMLAAHTLRTLVLLRQSESVRAAMRQNQAIVDYAVLIAESAALQSADTQTHEFKMEVQDGFMASVSIQLSDSVASGEVRDYRIVVQYPLAQAGDDAGHNSGETAQLRTWTSSWQSDGWGDSQ